MDEPSLDLKYKTTKFVGPEEAASIVNAIQIQGMSFLEVREITGRSTATLQKVVIDYRAERKEEVGDLLVESSKKVLAKLDRFSNKAEKIADSAETEGVAIQGLAEARQATVAWAKFAGVEPPAKIEHSGSIDFTHLSDEDLAKLAGVTK
jgi:hypothetical protein